ncbi:hypothetical protein MKUB_00690 [Mycobacterium kubicae]|uniref:Pyridoxamine 5-phosphate oxidase n=2 Tax=Mycobacterium kubicae TaxID=120959 RepID=A0ABQ1BFS4_9MYCO|nr:hypothetical protein MKUB_00690 [Mycobacterium kubicae]
MLRQSRVSARRLGCKPREYQRRLTAFRSNMKTLSETERQQFLSDKHVAVLSVHAADGRPPASVPIWYDYTPDGLIRINTSASTRKAKLIEKAGVVTLVVQREEPPYQYVVVEGTVVDTTSPAPVEDREAIAIRYLGEEGGRAFVRNFDDRESVLFTIRPDRWLTADFSGEL